MRFGLCVRLGVDLHVRFTEEGRRAHPAPTGGETQTWEGGMEEPRTKKEETTYKDIKKKHQKIGRGGEGGMG